MEHLPPSAFELAPRQPRHGALAGARGGGRWLRSALVLAAAIGVPALAAPEAWQGLAIGDAGSAELQIEPMPFERPGDSFPGAAFYYLAAEEPLVPESHSEAEGGIARALRIDLSGVDRTRALQCLTAAIYYEAASEPDQGQRAVAQVVLNRVAHPSYPNTVCGVVYQGSERVTGCQFSFTCDGSLARRPSRFFWQRAEGVARAALGGFVEPSVGLATHYHTIAVHPYWAPSLVHLTTIGAHRFYRFGGPAGMPGAFRFAYAGGEPIAAPHPRDAAASLAPDPALDPLAVQKAFAAAFRPAAADQAPLPVQGVAPRAPAPSYAPEIQQRGGEALYRGERLPEATGVRPEYQNSGKWIVKPGT
jgi:spore germination cell wall hydrolase CwlJ-like protein